MSSADTAFISTCRNIIDNGTWVKDERVRPKWEDGTPAFTKKVFGVVNRYDLSSYLYSYWYSRGSNQRCNVFRIHR